METWSLRWFFILKLQNLAQIRVGRETFKIFSSWEMEPDRSLLKNKQKHAFGYSILFTDYPGLPLPWARCLPVPSASAWILFLKGRRLLQGVTSVGTGALSIHQTGMKVDLSIWNTVLLTPGETLNTRRNINSTKRGELVRTKYTDIVSDMQPTRVFWFHIAACNMCDLRLNTCSLCRRGSRLQESGRLEWTFVTV